LLLDCPKITMKLVGLLQRGSQFFFLQRPAFPLAASFVIGISLAFVFPCHPVVWLAMVVALLVASAIALGRPIICSSLLLGAAALAGTAAAQLEHFYCPANHIAAFTTEEPRLAQLEVRLTSPPRLLTQPAQGRPLPPKESAHAQVLRIRTHAGWVPARGDITLTLDQPHPRLAIGQRVTSTGLLHRPAAAMNPGQFDYAAHYRSQRVLASMNVPHADAVVILDDPGPGPLEALREKSRRLLAAGFTPDRSLDHALLRALVLGDRDAEMRGVQDDFSRSGAAHLLAVSGLHVVLVAGFVLIVCRLLRLHPRTATILMMLCVLAYGLVVLPAAPALRATTLCLAYGLCQLIRRSTDSIQILALCAFGLLLFHPAELFTAGFQLSFLTVFFMLLCGPSIMRWCLAWLDDEHTRVARSFRPPGKWGGLWLWARNRFIASVGIGVLAWLVSIPLVMTHFDQWNPWAVFAGILLLPLVALGLIAGLAKVALTLLLPSLAGQWAAMAGFCMHVMRWAVNRLAQFPGADVPMPPPPVWVVVLFYALLLVPLVPWASEQVRRWLRRAPLATPLLAALPMFMTPAGGEAGETRVTLLAIGAGQIGVVELADGRTYLVDDGSSSLPDPLRAVLDPYLRLRGHRRIEAIFLSHPDYDHICAAADTADEFRVSRVYVNDVFREQSKDNEPAQAMLGRLEEAQVLISILSRGDSIALSGDTAIAVLWPPEGRAFRSTNNAGLVLRLACHGHAILFPADIQVATERELAAGKEREKLKAEVLVAPHHGSAEVTSGDFVKAVGPAAILSSNDRRLSRKQQEFDRLVGELPLYRTSRFGAVTVRISKEGRLRIETFVEPRKRGP
jgi:competence protein ComEC